MARLCVLMVVISTFSAFNIVNAFRGELIESDLLLSIDNYDKGFENHYKSNQVTGKYAASLFRIKYKTIDHKGNEAKASGLLILPLITKQVHASKVMGPIYEVDEQLGAGIPMISIQKGTRLLKNGYHLLSDMGISKPLAINALYYAMNGYATTLPAYLGFGENIDHFHPYLHAETEATAVIDMLKAAKQFCDKHGILINDKLFLTGNSQGGHATMATLEKLETSPTNPLPWVNKIVTAPISGPYDLSGTMFEHTFGLNGKPTYMYPANLLYLAKACQMVSGDLYEKTGDFFIDPVDSLVVHDYFPDYPLLPTLDINEVNKMLFDKLRLNVPTMFQPQVIEAILENPIHPLRTYFLSNDVYKFTTEKPIRFFYCEGDNTVPAENAIVAADYMAKMNKRNNSKAFQIDKEWPLSHSSCGAKSFGDVFEWFSCFNDSYAPTNLESTKTTPGSVQLSWDGNNADHYLVKIIWTSGRSVKEENISVQWDTHLTYNLGQFKSGEVCWMVKAYCDQLGEAATPWSEKQCISVSNHQSTIADNNDIPPHNLPAPSHPADEFEVDESIKFNNDSDASAVDVFKSTGAVINDLTIKLYPNPASDIIYLNSSESLTDPHITFITMDGKLFEPFTKPSSDKVFEIETTQMPAGVYQVQVADGKELVGYFKAVIR